MKTQILVTIEHPDTVDSDEILTNIREHVENEAKEGIYGFGDLIPGSVEVREVEAFGSAVSEAKDGYVFISGRVRV